MLVNWFYRLNVDVGNVKIVGWKSKFVLDFMIVIKFEYGCLDDFC